MRRPKRIQFYKRGFFNHPRHQSIALYLAELETSHGTLDARTNKDGKVTRPSIPYTDLEAGLTLGDCNRQITLEFSTHSRAEGAEIGNVQHKNDVLRSLVNEWCDAVDASLNQVRDVKWTAEAIEADFKATQR